MNINDRERQKLMWEEASLVEAWERSERNLMRARKMALTLVTIVAAINIGLILYVWSLVA